MENSWQRKTLVNGVYSQEKVHEMVSVACNHKY